MRGEDVKMAGLMLDVERNPIVAQQIPGIKSIAFVVSSKRNGGRKNGIF